MHNSWRTALLAIWVILVVSAGALAGGGFWIQGRAIVDTDPVLAVRAAILLSAAGACLFGAVVFLALWIGISAVVLEHEKDRRALRRSTH